MERLSQKDIRALLEFLRDSYALRDLDAFATHVVSALSRVVPADITTYNEVNPRQLRTNWRWNPAIEVPLDLQRAFERHMPEHPVIVHHARAHDGRTLKISDFLDRRRFHRLGLYAEFFRHFDVEHQMAVTLPAPRPLIIGIALNRSRRDFTERDRLLLNLLRPHLIQAYWNAGIVAAWQSDLARISEGIDALGRGVVVMSRDGTVRVATGRARRWLAEYFDRSPRPSRELPDALRRWVYDQERQIGLTDDVLAPRQPLVIQRDGRQLTVRLISDPGGCVLLLEERHAAPSAKVFISFGLTSREAEVLAWVVQGKTNPEIGIILGIRARTVGKHLERVYSKLGVETRTAAAARALEAAPPQGAT